eukprot:7520569-Pyramimonas_sp.AAC.1
MSEALVGTMCDMMVEASATFFSSSRAVADVGPGKTTRKTKTKEYHYCAWYSKTHFSGEHRLADPLDPLCTARESDRSVRPCRCDISITRGRGRSQEA